MILLTASLVAAKDPSILPEAFTCRTVLVYGVVDKVDREYLVIRELKKLGHATITVDRLVVSHEIDREALIVGYTVCVTGYWIGKGHVEAQRIGLVRDPAIFEKDSYCEVIKRKAMTTLRCIRLSSRAIDP
uniref:ARAD1B10010p n=1 Tax=Blastobotrys adeninivorans TaxID=409370 RepID=A0A060T5D0_BLAAD